MEEGEVEGCQVLHQTLQCCPPRGRGPCKSSKTEDKSSVQCVSLTTASPAQCLVSQRGGSPGTPRPQAGSSAGCTSAGAVKTPSDTVTEVPRTRHTTSSGSGRTVLQGCTDSRSREGARVHLGAHPFLPWKPSSQGNSRPREQSLPGQGQRFRSLAGLVGWLTATERAQLPAEQAEDKQQDSSPSSPAMLGTPAPAPP